LKSHLFPAHSTTAGALAATGFWEELLRRCAIRLAHRRGRLRTYAELVESGEMARMAAAYADGTLRLQPPVRRAINRSGGRRKVLFLFRPADEFLMRALNSVLQPMAAGLHSRLCHSFQPGRGVRTAYNQVMGSAGVEGACCLRLDIRDYFNSVPPARMLEALPAELRADPKLEGFLTHLLLDRRVLVEGAVVEDDHKGVMAGTPLAPLLANLYLRSLDQEFEGASVGYVRYADDFLVTGAEADVLAARQTMEARLADLGLGLNLDKTRVVPAGQAWEFLGLQYHGGRLDLATHTVRKMHRRVRRLARKARSREDPAGYFVGSLNRRIYGIGGDPADFTWATWFFPLLSGDTSLRGLDAVVQEQARFAITGRHEHGNRGAVPYAALRAAGYLPMVSAYHAYRRGGGRYAARLEAAAEGRS
jgi:hypothetical protein